MSYTRCFIVVILAAATLFLAPTPDGQAKAGKKAPSHKKAPKPKHPAKHKAKAKAKHTGHKAAHKKTPKHKKNKRAHAKPKHHAKPHVTPKARHHAVTKKKRDKKEVRSHRTHARTANRLHEWSKQSHHERHWHDRHWHTHHFANFHHSGGVVVGGGGGTFIGGEGGTITGGSFQFDPGWWNNYVVNPGTPGWSGPPASAPGKVGPPPPVVAIDKPLPLSPAGQALAKQLDSLQVEKNWLPFQEVEWKTGKAPDPSVRGPASNGGAFVAAACRLFKLTLPTSEKEDFLPGNQMDWLMTVGKERGWVKVGEVEAQTLANQGWVVIAAWQNLSSAGHRDELGQLAIVHPDVEPVSELAARGPLVTMAGKQNHNTIGIKDGFPAGAWNKQEIVYLTHRLAK